MIFDSLGFETSKFFFHVVETLLKLSDIHDASICLHQACQGRTFTRRNLPGPRGSKDCLIVLTASKQLSTFGKST